MVNTANTMDEYEFLEPEEHLTHQKLQKPVFSNGNKQSRKSNELDNSPLRRALEQPPLKRIKVTLCITLLMLF